MRAEVSFPHGILTIHVQNKTVNSYEMATAMKQANIPAISYDPKTKRLIILVLLITALMLGATGSSAQENPAKRELLLQRQSVYAAMTGVRSQIIHLEGEYQKLLMGLADIDRSLSKIDSQGY